MKMMIVFMRSFMIGFMAVAMLIMLVLHAPTDEELVIARDVEKLK